MLRPLFHVLYVQLSIFAAEHFSNGEVFARAQQREYIAGGWRRGEGGREMYVQVRCCISHTPTTLVVLYFKGGGGGLITTTMAPIIITVIFYLVLWFVLMLYLQLMGGKRCGRKKEGRSVWKEEKRERDVERTKLRRDTNYLLRQQL